MDLNIDIRTRGRASSPVAGAVVRPLERADLALLEAPRGSVAPPVQKIRHTHHALARAVAQGLSNEEVSAVTGYSPSRVSILLQDPAISNLIEIYRERQTEIWAEAQERAKDAVILSLEVMTEKVETLSEADSEEAFDHAERLLKAATPVSGLAAKPSQNVQVNVNLSGRLEAARRRAGLIEGHALPPTEESVS